MSDEEVIQILQNISLRINKILPVIVLVGGTVGNICNVIIFSRRSQRTNPISWYFLVNTIANIFGLYWGVLFRYLQDVAQIDLVNNNLIMCKIRSFLLYTTLSLSNWYILLATIDRYLISSNDHHRRRLSTIKNAIRIIALLSGICLLLYCHILILYNIQTTVISTNRVQNFCYPQRGPYRVFSDVQLLIQFSLLPPLLMIVFVFLIIQNIRLSHQRMASTISAHHQVRLKRRDVQLSTMLLLQVLLTIICSLPFAISQLTTTMTLNWTKTALRLAVENFCNQLGRNLAFINCSSSFYLYTMAGTQFRLEMQQIFNSFSMILYKKPLIATPRVANNAELVRPNTPTSIEPIQSKPVTTAEENVDQT